MFQTNVLEKNKTNVLNFPGKSAVYEKMWKNMEAPKG